MKTLKVVMLVMILSSYNANSQVNLTDQQARRALEKIDSLEVCVDEVQSVRAENELYQRRVEAFIRETASLRAAAAEWEKSSEGYRMATDAANKAMKRQEVRTLVWQIATPVALVLGYLLAK